MGDEGRAFRGSFSGYERDRLFYHPSGSGGLFVQSAYVFGLDYDHDGRAVAPVDIDGDGDLDLALLTLRGLRLLENTSAPQHFSRIRLTATRSPSQAVGAIVALTAGGITRRDFVKVTEGFRTQVPLDLHFGLGDTPIIETLEVRWPSGEVQRWRDLPVDQHLLVREGAATVEARPLDRWPDGTRPNVTESPSLSVELSTLEGGLASLAGGRPAVINFWAPWCAPCQTELPQLVALSERYGNEVDFVGVSVELEDLDSVREAIQAFGIPYAQFLADDAVMERFFGASAAAALPSTYVFDETGRLRRLFRGAVTEADLDALLVSFHDEGVREADLSLLARIAMRRGDYDAAVEHYTALADLQPERIAQIGIAWEHRRAVARFNIGLAHLNAGRPSEAVDDFRAALDQLGEDPAVLLQLGIAAADAGQLTLAASALERTVQADPASVSGWLHKARVHRQRDEVDAARNSYTRALRLDPDNRTARSGLATLVVPGGPRR